MRKRLQLDAHSTREFPNSANHFTRNSTTAFRLHCTPSGYIDIPSQMSNLLDNAKGQLSLAFAGMVYQNQNGNSGVERFES